MDNNRITDRIRDVHHSNRHVFNPFRKISDEQKAFTIGAVIVDEMWKEATRLSNERHQFHQKLHTLRQFYIIAENEERYTAQRMQLGLPVRQDALQNIKNTKQCITDKIHTQEKSREEFVKRDIALLKDQYNKLYTIYHAERLADKQFRHGMIIATTKFLNASGDSVTRDLQDLIKNLFKALIEDKI